MKVTNYIEEFAGGGNIKNQLIQLVKAAMAGDSDALKQIEQIKQGASQGDRKLLQYAAMIEQIMQGMQQQAEQQTAFAKAGAKIDNDKNDKVKYLKGLKCGGKAKKPKKAEKGFKATCGCKLKRVGGVILEVDACTELPIKNK